MMDGGGIEVRALCSWIDRHLDRFRPAKPLAELSLILYVLARHRDTRAWAHRTAERIRPEVDALRPCTLSGEDLLPIIVSDLLLERDRCPLPVAGCPLLMKSAFVSDMAGLYDCRAMAEDALTRELAEWDGRLASAKSSWMYNVTHQVFYATKLGTRPMTWPPERLAWLAEVLSSLAAARIASAHFDIAAELLLAVRWGGMRPAPSHAAAVDSLKALVRAEGRVITDARRAPETPDEFVNCYHATLITLALVAGAQS